jgi:uroporphyrinogen decarboxylase
MAEMMPHIPVDILAMGNVSPAKEFRNGTEHLLKSNNKNYGSMQGISKFPDFIRMRYTSVNRTG